ncbi:MAG: hypothetical protein N2653_00380 [Burkholderiales bacterium]|nr:hypothetical protein [Burkholderiales bacterium]
MPAPSPFAPFIEPLERPALPYCITGSVAASLYGEPRLTAEVDFVLLLESAEIPALRTAFPEAGYCEIVRLGLEVQRDSVRAPVQP